MAHSNPKKAMAAILPLPIKGGGVTVKPMTLGMWAALERIESPLVTGVDAKDTLDLLPSLYLLVNGADKLFSGNIVAESLAWADTLPATAINDIRLAAVKQMQTMFDVVPEAADSKKKRQTAGLPGSSHGRRLNLDGHTTR